MRELAFFFKEEDFDEKKERKWKRLWKKREEELEHIIISREECAFVPTNKHAKKSFVFLFIERSRRLDKDQYKSDCIVRRVQKTKKKEKKEEKEEEEELLCPHQKSSCLLSVRHKKEQPLCCYNGSSSSSSSSSSSNHNNDDDGKRHAALRRRRRRRRRSALSRPHRGGECRTRSWSSPPPGTTTRFDSGKRREACATERCNTKTRKWTNWKSPRINRY